MTTGARPIWGSAAGLDTSPMRLVTLSILADRDYLALARTSAMHVGGLLALPLGRVTDLRLAVNEACAGFLDGSAARHAPADAPADAATDLPTDLLDQYGIWASPETMEIAYDLYTAELHVTVRAAAPEHWPEANELGWTVLQALVGGVRVSVHEGLGALTLILPLTIDGVDGAAGAP